MENNKIKAVFTDLDGTLLDKNHTVSLFTRNVLSQLREQHPDVKFVVATGRPYQDVLETMRLLDLRPDYIISNNGAVVHEGVTHAPVCHHTMPVDVVERLLSIPLPMSEASSSTAQAVSLISVNMYREDWLATLKPNNLGNAYRPSFQPRVVEDLVNRKELHEQVYSMFFYGPHEHLARIEAALQRDFTSAATISFSLPYILDVAPRGIDKGTAIRDVLKLLNVAAEDAVAFGDGMNDLPMLHAVGRGYLMENSLPRLLAAAPELEKIASNADDGVAKKITELFSLQAQKNFVAE